MRKHLNNVVIIFIILIIYSTQAQRADDCLKQGFQECLDNLGQCTSDLSSCSQGCKVSEECEKLCCINGYCLKQELCQRNAPQDQHSDLQRSKKTQKMSLNKFLEHLEPFFITIFCLSPIFCFAYCKYRGVMQRTVVEYEGEILNTENEQLDQEKSGKPLNNSLDCTNCNASVFQHDLEKATQISDFVPQQVIDQISLYKSLRYLAISFSQNLLGNESGLLLGNIPSKLQNNYLEDTATQSKGQGLTQLQNLQQLEQQIHCRGSQVFIVINIFDEEPINFNTSNCGQSLFIRSWVISIRVNSEIQASNLSSN
ncbi:hypothetical protein ABPG72_014553 [Tetrahymena utriculariae]